MIVVFSDLFDDRREALSRFSPLGRRKNDVAVFHLVDPAELDLPLRRPHPVPLHGGRPPLEVNPREIRAELPRGVHAVPSSTVKRTCAEADVDYERVRTDEPLDQVLLRFLARRRKRPVTSVRAPRLLWGGLAAAIPLLVHLFDRRRPAAPPLRGHRLRAPRPAAHRLAAAAEAAAPLRAADPHPARSPLALAARGRSSPAERRSGAAARATAIVLDTSLSMR